MNIKITKSEELDGEPLFVASSSSGKNLKSNRKCDICSKSNAQYTCPRCNNSYCNLTCYQSQEHANCSEEFYKEQVLGELKNCRIDDTNENRSKIAEILKRDLKLLENNDDFELKGETVSNDQDDDEDDEEDQDSSDNDDNLPVNLDEADPDDLARVYEDEMKKWQPWWTNSSDLTTPKIIDTSNDQTFESHPIKFNKTLLDASKLVNVSNANEFFYNEVLQTTFLYIILAYVYQLDEKDLDALADLSLASDVDLSLVDEMCSAYLEIQTLLLQQNKKIVDLGKKFDLIIASLLQEEKFFLKNYINKQFLSSVLNDLKRFCEHPMAHQKAQSHLYTLFETSLNKKTRLNDENNVPAERPINVFHMNKNQSKAEATKIELKSTTSEKKTKIEILSKRVTNKQVENKQQQIKTNVVDNKKAKSCSLKKDSRLFMKKLEFEFKWTSVNMSSLQSSVVVERITGTIENLRDSIQKYMQDFEVDHGFIKTNLNLIRNKSTTSTSAGLDSSTTGNKKLIEEL